MGYELSKKEIGERIASLRSKKGISQEDLAKSIAISRPSLTQIELGNRGVSLIEMQKISIALGFSLDDFMTKAFLSNQSLQPSGTSQEKVTSERVSVPTLNINKFKNVLLYILERCAGKPNVGETVLYKLLYFSDFNYYELYEEHLTGARYKKLPYGPVPQKLDAIISQMIDANQLQRIKTEFKGFPQKRYLPLEKADLTGLKASEKDVIDKVIEQMSDWSATAISDYSHKDLPWEVTEEGKDISYNLAFYRELPYSVRVYDEDDND
ncbi:Transcriptional regulator, contains XRE-family HTH domain [Pedobacter terrae]|uniref:Transcriptional regulator, contains XRE-family HTH domain n=1 Tax=Pedobacter terrae TaxID=405671 RepID=A0A1G7NXF8_9SPHI|nr:type II toxin-antitoxin system antitoxin SocA domain-containing protein [Pedobacter terrae]SDF78673.1 Transcriptional regulator, contains XRE-family HTH domain [Pedobacter terrae]